MKCQKRNKKTEARLLSFTVALLIYSKGYTHHIYTERERESEGEEGGSVKWEGGQG